ncbi:MAG: hypothetical protein QMD12_00835 [Candidatus Aenigmarchaeota archaeon]|nr:hypothetical protein [Candidatus Aenigmarchaeota archaeon]
MIKRFLFAIFLLFLLNIFYTKTSTAVSISSQNYRICPIITAGGGMSVGSNYKLFSVIGQPTISNSSSNSYKLELGLYDECNTLLLLYSPYFETLSYAGDMNYFNIFWRAGYPILSFNPNRELAVECYLNSNQRCIPFPFIQNPGSGTCAVYKPQYEFGTSPDGTVNNVSCKVYDPNIGLFRWRNESFIPVAFDVSVLPLITLAVGQPFSLQIIVKNKGLITDNYTVVVSSNSPILLIEHGNTTIVGLKSEESEETYARINILAAVPASLDINVTSAVSGLKKKITMEIRGGMMSLSELDFIGVAQIILIATLLFAYLNPGYEEFSTALSILVITQQKKFIRLKRTGKRDS